SFGRASRFLLMMLKTLRRNPVRSSLTYLAAFVLVAVITIVWSALYTLERLTQEKTTDIKVVVSEKWQVLSELPWGYAAPLSEGASSRSTDVRPQDSMTWQIYLGTLDRTKQTRENQVIFIALDPAKLPLLASIFADVPTQADQRAGKLERSAELQAAVHAMQQNKRAVMMDRRQLGNIQKGVGDRFAVMGINFQGVDLEFEIIAAFPEGRYVAVMNRDYLNDALDSYPKTHAGLKHPHANKSLNRVWLQVPDREAFSRIAEQIESSGLFQDPEVRCETLSSAVVTQLDSYRDLMWGMRWLLSPAILTTMALVIANAISLGVRERRSEIAVLKVLGFRPVQILGLVLGEAVLIGALSGLFSSLFVYQAINRLVDNSAS